MNELIENKLSINLDTDSQANSFALLKELGSRHGYVTYEDIHRIFPETEQDIDSLDQIYIGVRQAGIVIREVEDGDGAEDGRPAFSNDNLLTNVAPDNLVELYFLEAARHPLLTIQEEVSLSKRIERGLIAREEISETRFLSEKRLEELLFLIEDSWNAVNHLITANSRLVISIAKKYMYRGVPFLDLIQEGNIGLMRAAKKFDYKRGYKFSTYATWWIRQAVTRALADQSRTIRLPVHRSDQLSKMFRTQHKLKQNLGHDPNTAEIAEAMDLPPEKIVQMSKDARFPLSLDMPISVEDDNVLGDFIEDHESPDPDEITTIRMLRQHIDQILENLPPREVQILKLRYGLADGETHTLREVGLKIGVTRERIRQIEAQAIRRLRHPEIQHKLRSYVQDQ